MSEPAPEQKTWAGLLAHVGKGAKMVTERVSAPGKRWKAVTQWVDASAEETCAILVQHLHRWENSAKLREVNEYLAGASAEEREQICRTLIEEEWRWTLFHRLLGDMAKGLRPEQVRKLFALAVETCEGKAERTQAGYGYGFWYPPLFAPALASLVPGLAEQKEEGEEQEDANLRWAFDLLYGKQDALLFALSPALASVANALGGDAPQQAFDHLFAALEALDKANAEEPVQHKERQHLVAGLVILSQTPDGKRALRVVNHLFTHHKGYSWLHTEYQFEALLHLSEALAGTAQQAAAIELFCEHAGFVFAGLDNAPMSLLCKVEHDQGCPCGCEEGSTEIYSPFLALVETIKLPDQLAALEALLGCLSYSKPSSLYAGDLLKVFTDALHNCVRNLAPENLVDALGVMIKCLPGAAVSRVQHCTDASNAVHWALSDLGEKLATQAKQTKQAARTTVVAARRGIGKQYLGDHWRHQALSAALTQLDRGEEAGWIYPV